MYKSVRGAKVLYVEDDEIISLHLVCVFEKLGAKVIHCKSYNHAIEQFQNQIFDVIITDIVLDDKTGLELIHFIRFVNKSIPILITSGYAETKHFLDAIEYGVDKYFIKPFKETDLFDYVNKIMLGKANPNEPLEELADNFLYSFDAKVLLKDESKIKLSPQEINLIEFLLKNKGKVVRYKEIQTDLAKIEGGEITIDTLRTVIKNIRKKSTDDLILTQSGLGYKIP